MSIKISNSSPEALLKAVFGYETFKPLQREIIEAVLNRRDSLVIMPTGGGKSLCYQIPALIFPGLTVVVSPLIALMKDQVEQLQELGVRALFLNSSLSLEEYQANYAQVRSGKVKLLYVAPENLLTERTLNLLASVKFDCLAIDEAHCISEWGHDFRPEYRQIVAVRERFPNVVCMALTATATPRVREDIQKSLGFEESNEFVASFNRENLLIEVVPKNDPFRQTLELMERYKDQSGIIYCFSRKQVDELAAALERKGHSVKPYHAGLEDDERRRNQELFIHDDVQIIVATIAFGMGINKPNVRFVIHYDLPKSIEGYYQEIGRAGRDGLPAHCLLLFSRGDMMKLKSFIDQKEGTERDAAYQHLAALTRYAEGEGCRRVPLLKYFGETYTKENCGMCDKCLGGPREEIDVTIPAQKFLSCVARTGERFGMVHIIDVLLGSENQKVLKFSHQTLSTYGIGKDLTRDQWSRLARQLVAKGLLDQDSAYGSLRLTKQAYAALKNREPIFGVLADEADMSPVGGGQEPQDQVLFERLRAKRKALADKHRVPPYAIFPDRTLVEMATYFPQSEESLLKIHGVGQVKLQNYGDIFLEVIREYCKPKNLPEKRKPAASQASSAPKNLTQTELKRPRYVEVSEAFNAGQSVRDLMDAYDVQVLTIIDHLTKYALEGKPLRAGENFLQWIQVSPEMLSRALDAFIEEERKNKHVKFLRPVFDSLGGAVDFDSLKFIRLEYLTTRK